VSNLGSTLESHHFRRSVKFGSLSPSFGLAYEQGESLGALNLGHWFESGEGVTKNLPTSVLWYERASDLGNFFATHRLHMAYMAGDLGLPRDESSAKRYEDLLFQQTETGTPNRPASPE
jgi:TPR repeat protein